MFFECFALSKEKERKKKKTGGVCRRGKRKMKPANKTNK